MKILLCSDGHLAAEQAIRFVAAFASSWEAETVLLGIVEHAPDEPALKAALERGADILRERKAPVEVMTCAGDPLEEIRRHTQQEKYDFVGIGVVRKGAGPSALSQKAYGLVRELDLPVMVVPAAAAGSPFRTDGMRILMCSSGSQAAEPVVSLAVRLAGRQRLPVTLLHVHPVAPALYANLLEWEMEPKRLLASRSALARNLRQEREALRAAGLEATVEMRFGGAAAQIMEEARTGQYAFIVMGAAPSQGPVRHYVMGDVAATLLSEVETPVVIMKTGAARRGLLRKLGGLFSRPAEEPR